MNQPNPPGPTGASPTLARLEALAIPPLAGLRFLDAACGEGFFCGFAQFDGAAIVVGIDSGQRAIERARERFPGCDFRCQSWSELPEGPFDVILLASALYRADDQQALVRALLSRLAPEGLLILELGIAGSRENEWVKVRHGSSERLFPTLAKLPELFRGAAWKHLGARVKRPGDRVSTLVYHLRRRKPFAYLLLKPPAFGKSTLARELFTPAGVRVVSGDQLIHGVARQHLTAPPALAAVIAEDFSSTTIDRTVERILERGLGEEFVRFLVEQGGTEDFVLDAFLPESLHNVAERVARESGFLPVTLQWGPPHPRPSRSRVHERAFAYCATLPGEEPLELAPRGYVDNVELADKLLRVRGWAFDSRGELPETIEIEGAGSARLTQALQPKPRADVQATFSLTHDLVGFELELPFEGVTDNALEALAIRFRDCRGELSAPLRIARKKDP